MTQMTTSFTSFAWVLTRLASLQGYAVDSQRLHAAFAQSKQAGDALEAAISVCRYLEFEVSRVFQEPDGAQLPLLCLTPAGDWGVVVDHTATGRWRIAAEQGDMELDSPALKGRLLAVVCSAERAHPSLTPLEQSPDHVGFRTHLNAALRKHRGSLWEACLASAFIGLLALATSLFSMQVYDRVIPTRGEYTLFVLAGGVTISVLIELAMKFARAHLMDHVVVGVDSQLSKEIFHRLLKLRVDQLPASVGSLAAQLRGYEQVRSFYTASSLFTLIDVPMALIFLGVVTLLATPLVGGVLLGFAILALVVGVSARKQVARQAREGAAFSNMKTGLLVEAVEGVETIKAGSGGWRFLSRWVHVNSLGIANDLKMRHTSESTGYLAGMIQQLSYAALIVTGALAVMQGHMTTGALVACSILSGRILSPILALPGLMVQHAHARAAQDGLEKLYALQMDNHGVHKPLSPERLEGRYLLEGVQFAFGENRPALQIGRLSMGPGERVAVLGPIGSGKSTLLRLLSGLYVPQKGRVLLDDLDLSQISRHVLSRQIGYLQQEHRLFQGTLRENLLIGLPDPGDAEILRAMKKTGMDRIVAAHPRGLELPIMEGGKGLSGGQRQLVAFTRLVLCNPDILLLDEPTASMDEEQERRCLAVLADEAKKGKSMIIVTHKTSVLPLVNRIIIIAGSSVIADGPRDEVLRELEVRQRAARAAAAPAPGVAAADALSQGASA